MAKAKPAKALSAAEKRAKAQELVEKLETALHNNGVSATPCRVDILRQLYQALPRSLSQRDLHTKLPDYDRVTLYRNLLLLTANQFILKNADLVTGSSVAHYRFNSALVLSEEIPMDDKKAHTDHAHFSCYQCGTEECLNIDIPWTGTMKTSLDKMGKALATRHFEVDDMRVVYQGICKSCVDVMNSNA